MADLGKELYRRSNEEDLEKIKKNSNKLSSNKAKRVMQDYETAGEFTDELQGIISPDSYAKLDQGDDVESQERKYNTLRQLLSQYRNLNKVNPSDDIPNKNNKINQTREWHRDRAIMLDNNLSHNPMQDVRNDLKAAKYPDFYAAGDRGYESKLRDIQNNGMDAINLPEEDKNIVQGRFNQDYEDNPSARFNLLKNKLQGK